MNKLAEPKEIPEERLSCVAESIQDAEIGRPDSES
jgi:hypothetical protein